MIKNGDQTICIRIIFDNYLQVANILNLFIICPDWVYIFIMNSESSISGHLKKFWKFDISPTVAIFLKTKISLKKISSAQKCNFLTSWWKYKFNPDKCWRDSRYICSLQKIIQNHPNLGTFLGWSFTPWLKCKVFSWLLSLIIVNHIDILYYKFE